MCRLQKITWVRQTFCSQCAFDVLVDNEVKEVICRNSHSRFIIQVPILIKKQIWSYFWIMELRGAWHIDWTFKTFCMPDLLQTFRNNCLSNHFNTNTIILKIHIQVIFAMEVNQQHPPPRTLVPQASHNSSLNTFILNEHNLNLWYILFWMSCMSDTENMYRLLQKMV